MKPEQTTVSVVIPCYNAAAFVERAVRSAMEQSAQPMQIICVDDGSTDGTLGVIHELSERQPGRLEVIAGSRAGAGAARNKGLAAARGDYVQFLDADDALLPQKLRTQLQLVGEQEQRPTIVAGGFEHRSVHGLSAYRGLDYESVWANLIVGRLGVTSANLWLRSAVVDVGGWNESQPSSQEYELMFRLLKQGAAAVFCHQPLTLKFIQPDGITSITGKPNPQRHGCILRYVELRRSMAEHLESRGLMSDGLRHVYYETIHKMCRDLFPYDPDEAGVIHREVLPSGYRLGTLDGPGRLAIDDLLCPQASMQGSLVGEVSGEG